MDTTGPSTHVMGLRCGRLRIGVVDGVFGRSHAPAGEEGEAAAIGNAIYTEGMLGYACALEGGGGSVHWGVHTGHTRLHDRVVPPTTKSYLRIQFCAAPSTWFLARGAKRHRLRGSFGSLDKIFRPRGAHGDHTHVDRVRVVGKKAGSGSHKRD